MGNRIIDHVNNENHDSGYYQIGLQIDLVLILIQILLLTEVGIEPR